MRASGSRTPNHWQSLQPVFGIIFGYDGAFTYFPTAQAARFEFLICFGSARTVAFAELGNAHCSLQSTALLLNDGHVGYLAIYRQEGPGDRARTFPGNGEIILSNAGLLHHAKLADRSICRPMALLIALSRVVPLHIDSTTSSRSRWVRRPAQNIDGRKPKMARG